MQDVIRKKEEETELDFMRLIAVAELPEHGTKCFLSLKMGIIGFALSTS